MKNKLLSTMVASSICVLAAPMMVNAADLVKDSIGSVNMEDDGVTVGFDENQSQKTEYSSEITADASETTKVYVSQASTFGVIIPKTIILDGKNKNAEYVVDVNGNIGGLDTVNVVPDASFKLSQLGKQDIDATVTQDKTAWLFDELDTNGNGSIVAEKMTAGSWNGKFNFNISMTGGETNKEENNTLAAGLYNADGSLEMTWEELINPDNEYLYVDEDGFLCKYTTGSFSGDNIMQLGGKLVIDSSVTGIGSYTFSSCEYLTEIHVPSSVTSIELCAFMDCYSATIYLPSTLTNVESGAFSGVPQVYYDGSLDTSEWYAEKIN